MSAVESLRLTVVSELAHGLEIEVREEVEIGRLAIGALADDRRLSRRHARVYRGDGGEYVIEDLGSVNGSTVNGTRISGPCFLAAGDEIALGSCVLHVAMAEREPSQPPVAATVIGDVPAVAPAPAEAGEDPEQAGIEEKGTLVLPPAGVEAPAAGEADAPSAPAAPAPEEDPEHEDWVRPAWTPPAFDPDSPSQEGLPDWDAPPPPPLAPEPVSAEAQPAPPPPEAPAPAPEPVEEPVAEPLVPAPLPDDLPDLLATATIPPTPIAEAVPSAPPPPDAPDPFAEGTVPPAPAGEAEAPAYGVDLSKSPRTPVGAAPEPASAGRRVTLRLAIDLDSGALEVEVEGGAGVRVVPDGRGWRIEPDGSAAGP